MDPPLEPPEGMFSTSDLQKNKVINVYCFKSLGVWYFIMLEKQNDYNVRGGGTEQYEESILHTGEQVTTGTPEEVLERRG